MEKFKTKKSDNKGIEKKGFGTDKPNPKKPKSTTKPPPAPKKK